MAGTFPYSQFTYDDSLGLADSNTVTATGETTTIIDLGDGLFDGFLVVDISALDMTTGDEAYRLNVEGSTVAAMTSTSKGLAGIDIGNTVVPMDADDAAITSAAPARLVIPFRNERMGTLYRYVRLHYVLGGTSPSMTFLAFLAKR